MTGWSAQSLYGVTPQAPSMGIAAPTQQMGTMDDHGGSGLRTLLDPENPLLWFGVILAVTMGAAGAAGSVRLGRAKVGASIGSA